MEFKEDKCNFLVDGYKYESIWVKTDAAKIGGKLVGVEIDKHISFDEHVSNLCKNACGNFLARLWCCMSLKQRIISVKFGYSPLVWMCIKNIYRSSRPGCSENMQQIYRRISMPNCDFNKVALHIWTAASALIT